MQIAKIIEVKLRQLSKNQREMLLLNLCVIMSRLKGEEGMVRLIDETIQSFNIPVAGKKN